MKLSVRNRRWMTDGACADHRELFERDTHTGDLVLEARRVCLVCPVRAECASYAAETRPCWGIWAGELWAERCTRRVLTASP